MPRKDSEFMKRLAVILKRVNSAGLARRLGVSDSRIPEWKTGKLPSADTLIKLGTQALELGLPDPFFFWALAGVDVQGLKSMASKVVEWEHGAAGPTVPVRRYRYTETGEKEEAGRPVSVDSEFVPNPGKAICLCVGEKSPHIGDSPNGLILLDTSAEGTKWSEELSGRVVMLDYVPKDSGMWPVGLYMGRIFRQLVAQPPTRISTGIVLETLTEEGASRVGRWLPVAAYTEPAEAFTAAQNDKERLEALTAEFRQRALSKLCFREGVQLLGEVNGRLTGHLSRELRRVTIPQDARK